MTLDKVSIGVNLFPKNRLKHLSHRNLILYRALPHLASITVLSALAPSIKIEKRFEKPSNWGSSLFKTRDKSQTLRYRRELNERRLLENQGLDSLVLYKS